MSNYTRNTLTGDLAPINAELEKVQNAIADKLDRVPSVSQANQLNNTLDANSNRIINLPAPSSPNDAARLVDVAAQSGTSVLPPQSGQNNRYLKTDGTTPFWSNVTKAEVGLGNVDNTTDALKPISIATNVELSKKASYVNTFTALALLSPTEGEVFVCVERANAEYIVQAAAYTALAGDVTFANGRVAKLQINGVGDAHQFGAIGNNIVDDTAALNGWLSRGKNHYLPAGIYKTTASLTNLGQDFKIFGAGKYITNIRSTGNYSTLILSSPGSEISRCELRGFTISAEAGDKSAGASIEATVVLKGAVLTDIRLSHYFDGFLFSAGCNRMYMTNISYDSGGRTAGTNGRYTFHCPSITTSMVDWHMINMQGSGFEAGGGHNISAHFYLRKFDGIYLTNSHFFYGDRIFDINPVSGSNCTSILCSNTYFDTMRLNHIRVNPETGVVLKQWDFDGCTFRDAEESSSILLLNTSVLEHLRINGGTMWGNYGNAISQVSATDFVKGLVVSGVTFTNNNTVNTTGGGDISIGGSNSVITGNSFEGGGATGNCVRFISGGDNNIATTNNMSLSTCTTKILDQGTGNITTGNLL